MSLSLNEKLNAAVDMGFLKKEIPNSILDNLASHISLRPYQISALTRFFSSLEDSPHFPANTHLLFHMATGSGKTVIMAALLLYLYQQGYRNFLFFVNSSQIIEKTKENFINPASSKYLLAPEVWVDSKPVGVRAVENFDDSSDEAINIHFTTIQALHTRMHNPRENSITIEDFREQKLVMFSDEAHHINVETKRKLTKSEENMKNSWESTVMEIFSQHTKNMLLEFTATADLSNEGVRKKYHDKILY